MIEISQVVVGPTEFAQINQLVGELVGKTCWNLGFSYGDELCCDFGTKLTYGPGPLAGEHYGEWDLGTRASPWAIRHADGSIITSSAVEPQEAKAFFEEVTGRRVVSAAVSLPHLDLVLEFDGGQQLGVKACQEESTDREEAASDSGDGDDIEIACWELYMPEGRILQVWPGQRWSLQSYERQ